MNSLCKFLLALGFYLTATNLIRAQSGSINLLPRYGNIEKSSAMLKLDEEFIDFCDKNFPNRQAASAYHAAKGWSFFGAGDYTTAIRRFNQSWLLDSTNANAFWGFGAITAIRLENDVSLQFFQKSYQLNPT